MAYIKVDKGKNFGASYHAGFLNSTDESSKDIEASNNGNDGAKSVAKVFKKDRGLTNISTGVCMAPQLLTRKSGKVPILGPKYNPKSTKLVSLVRRQNPFPNEPMKAWHEPNEEQGSDSSTKTYCKKSGKAKIKGAEIEMDEIKVDKKKSPRQMDGASK